MDRRVAPRHANPALLPAAMSSLARVVQSGVVQKLEMRTDDLPPLSTARIADALESQLHVGSRPLQFALLVKSAAPLLD